jgi:hypothetical protein
MFYCLLFGFPPYFVLRLQGRVDLLDPRPVWVNKKAQRKVISVIFVFSFIFIVNIYIISNTVWYGTVYVGTFLI